MLKVEKAIALGLSAITSLLVWFAYIAPIQQKMVCAGLVRPVPTVASAAN
jgi:hypothetical protein